MRDQYLIQKLESLVNTLLSDAVSFKNEFDETMVSYTERIRQWHIGEGDLHPAVVLTIWHGNAPSDAGWFHQFQAHFADEASPEDFMAIIPDREMFSRLLTTQSSELQHLTETCGRVRILTTGAPASTSPALPGYTPAFDAIIRSHHELPPFLCVDSSNRVIVSPVSSDNAPSTKIVIQSPLIAAMAREAFGILWRSAESFASNSHSPEWCSLLRLLYSGDTVSSASRRLRYSTRKANELLNRACAHYDVTTIFDLGIAWGADNAHTISHRSDREC